MSAGRCVVPEDACCVISPQAWWFKKWDVLMIMLLLFVASVTPYEVAFLQGGKVDPLFVANRLVDLCFWIDLHFQFFLGYFDPIDNVWIWDHKAIACRYLKSWFIIDFTSCLPFDMVGMVFESDSLSSLKVLRVIRLCRLIKLLRILKASRVLKRVQDSLDMSFTAMSLIKFFVSVMVVVHWTACTWGMVPNIEESEVNWTTESAFESVADGHELYTPATRYLASVFFALNLMVLGVPDMIGPHTMTEIIVVIICMLIAGSTYAYMIGSICSVVSNMDPATKELNQTIDNLKMHVFFFNNARILRARASHARGVPMCVYGRMLTQQQSDRLIDFPFRSSVFLLLLFLTGTARSCAWGPT